MAKARQAEGGRVANRKGVVSGTTETVDNRPHIPGLYQRVLPVVCLREISRSPRFAYHGFATCMTRRPRSRRLRWRRWPSKLAEQRLAAGTPIKAWHYDMPKE